MSNLDRSFSYLRKSCLALIFVSVAQLPAMEIAPQLKKDNLLNDFDNIIFPYTIQNVPDENSCEAFEYASVHHIPTNCIYRVIVGISYSLSNYHEFSAMCERLDQSEKDKFIPLTQEIARGIYSKLNRLSVCQPEQKKKILGELHEIITKQQK